MSTQKDNNILAHLTATALKNARLGMTVTDLTTLSTTSKMEAAAVDVTTFGSERSKAIFTKKRSAAVPLQEFVESKRPRLIEFMKETCDGVKSFLNKEVFEVVAVMDEARKKKRAKATLDKINLRDSMVEEMSTTIRQMIGDHPAVDDVIDAAILITEKYVKNAAPAYGEAEEG